MPIKIKKFDIDEHTENPEIGYMYLGFDDTGTLVQKDENGYYTPVVRSEAGKTFDRLTVKYLTVGGFRITGHPEGDWTIAQGTSNTCSGDISFVRGKYSNSDGYLSYASGEYVTASGTSSYVWGRGANQSIILSSDGINSFVHQYIVSSSSSIGTLSDYSVILGGYDHNIGTGSDGSVIIGGYENTISSNSTNSAIIGGYENTIQSGLENVIYLGRNNLTTYASEGNTTYVTKLCLDILPPSNYGTPPPDGLIWYQSGDIRAMVGGFERSLVAPDSSDFVTRAGTQTISGQKSFTSSITIFNSKINISDDINFTDTGSINFTEPSSKITFTENFNIQALGNYASLTITSSDGLSSASPTAGKNITIQSGTGGRGTTTGGASGSLNLNGGTGYTWSTGYISGGDVYVRGGNVTATGGAAGGNGGDIYIYSGNGNTTNGYGGDINIESGSGQESGNITIKTKDSYTSGEVTIRGGNSTQPTSYGGGDIYLMPGTGVSGNATVSVNSTSPDHSYRFYVNGNSYLNGNSVVNGTFTINSTSSLIGNVTMSSNLTVNGSTSLGNNTSDNLNVIGPTYLNWFYGPTTRTNWSNSDRILTVGSNGLIKNNYMFTSFRYVDNVLYPISNISSVSRAGLGMFNITFGVTYTTIPSCSAIVESDNDNQNYICYIRRVTSYDAVLYIVRADGSRSDKNFHFTAFGWF